MVNLIHYGDTAMTQQYTEGYVPVKFVLEYRFIDGEHDHEKEFPNTAKLLGFLNGQRESDFDWLCLHDNNTDLVIDGWSDIYQYIHENTGAVKTPDSCSITCTHGKGLACPVCYDQTYNLSQCGDACNCMKCRIGEIPSVDEQWANSEPVIDPFDVYEPHELPPDAPKSSSIALREAELNLPHVDVDGSDLPRVERFGDLPDGTLFYLAQTYAYGGRKKLIKTLEDGGLHNAVYNEYGGIGINVDANRLVIRA